jgi:hypothetical protein
VVRRVLALCHFQVLLILALIAVRSCTFPVVGLRQLFKPYLFERLCFTTLSTAVDVVPKNELQIEGQASRLVRLRIIH